MQKGKGSAPVSTMPKIILAILVAAVCAGAIYHVSLM
jgi:hypothetical protein